MQKSVPVFGGLEAGKQEYFPSAQIKWVLGTGIFVCCKKGSANPGAGYAYCLFVRI